MKVQINSLDALERLLGGDTTVEIELRGAIVQEFAKKHLKALAKSEAITKAVTAAQDEIIRVAQVQLNESVAHFTQTYTGAVHNLKLHPTVQAEIKRQVDAMVDDMVTKIVRAAIAEKLATESLEQMVARRVDYYAGDRINQLVRAKLDELKTRL